MFLSAPEPCAGCKKNVHAVGKFYSKRIQKKDTCANSINIYHQHMTTSNDIRRQLYFPESLIHRFTVHLHIMEIGFNLLQHTGLIATDSDASKPKGCCTSSLTAELEAAHRQYFYP